MTPQHVVSRQVRNRLADRVDGPAPAPRTKYPYDVWVDGNQHTIIRGVHFQQEPRAFLSQLRQVLRYRYCHGLQLVGIDDTSITFRTYYKE